MNQQQCDAQFEEFVRQSNGDGRNFPIKVEGNNILTDDSSDVHQPHNGFGYLMHCGWAARQLFIRNKLPSRHLDFGSYLYFASIASAGIADFVYHDLRPYAMPLPGLRSVSVDLTKLPYPDESERSVSCLHVLEHVGLGRYGDEIDSLGDVKAARELSRIISRGGHLIFVVPVNQQPGTVYNAHRQYTYDQVVKELFPLLHLVQFSLINQNKIIIDAGVENIVSHPGNVEDTGCFWFSKI
ncbi:MAG: DUF268 domain-containing protein [Candidatus Acidiferrales bacterium]